MTRQIPRYRYRPTVEALECREAPAVAVGSLNGSPFVLPSPLDESAGAAARISLAVEEIVMRGDPIALKSDLFAALDLAAGLGLDEVPAPLRPDEVGDIDWARLVSLLYSIFGPRDPFASTPYVPISNLRRGDILVSTAGDDPISLGIRIGSWSNYSHSLIYLGKGKIIDARAPGVHVRPIEELLGSASKVSVLRHPLMTSAFALQIKREGLSEVGAEYNWAGLAEVSIRKIWRVASTVRQIPDLIAALSHAETLSPELDDNGMFFCSQFVRQMYQRAGLPLIDATGAAPGDIVRLLDSGKLRAVGRLRTGLEEALVRTFEQRESQPALLLDLLARDLAARASTPAALGSGHQTAAVPASSLLLPASGIDPSLWELPDRTHTAVGGGSVVFWKRPTGGKTTALDSGLGIGLSSALV